MSRSNFLVHWTGKDVGTNPATLTAGDRVAYVDRLFDILSNGFWMTTPCETIVGGHPQGSPASVTYTYLTPMTCFTEVRLSAAAQHAANFGLLGIAVDRVFVLSRWGSPIHYVRNGPDEHIAGSLALLRNRLGQLLSATGDPDARQALESANYLGVFLKAMSKPSGDDFAYIDEHEWRVAFTPEQVDRSNMLPLSSGSVPASKLLLPAAEVRLIVVPDTRTRAAVLADPRLSSTLTAYNCDPPILTLDDCRSL